MSTLKRSFRGKAVEMLTVTEIILNHAIAHKTELQAVRSTWSGTYFEDLRAEVQKVTLEYFGVDAAKNMREATALLNGMQKTVLKELSLLKVQVEEDFKKDKSFVESTLTVLGFRNFYEDARKLSQEALVQLLYQFRQNMDETLKTKLVTAGIGAKLIEDIQAKADVLQKANVIQEVYKGNRKTVSQETTVQFNELYEKVISISKIATKIFQKDQALKDKFNYAKNLQVLTGAASSATLARKAKAKAALQPA